MDPLTRPNDTSIRDNAPCCICSTKAAKPLYAYVYREKASEILKCQECGHLFVHPVPLVELDQRTMDSLSDAEFFGSNVLKILHEHLIINKEIRSVRKFVNSSHPTLLDVGCGTGWSTAIWQKCRFKVLGLEPSKTRSGFGQKTYHIPVVHQYIENFSTEEKFDVIILRHLLEHIENPRTILKKVKSFLKPDGLLVIIAPNINCIGRYAFRKNWAWILPWHLHFYTPKTLTSLLTKVGFVKLKLYQTPSPLWYPHALNTAIFGPSAKSGFPKPITFILCAPIILLGLLLNLNDNMTLIFRNCAPENNGPSD